VPVNYFAEYLETEELPQEAASAALGEYIKRKYEGRHIDVVIAVTSAALQFVLRYREKLFRDVPIVFLSARLPQVAPEHSAAGITGVLSDAPYDETLALALGLHPSTKRVFVVARSPSVEGYDDLVRAALNRFSSLVKFTYIDARTVPALLAAVKTIPAQSVLFYTRYAPDGSSSGTYPDKVARLMAAASPVPIYTIDDVYVGSGVVGGIMRTGEATGRRLGEIASQILDGTRPEDIPIADVPMTPVFDWRQLRGWGIETSQLPADSRVLFRTPTVWEMYGWYIVGAMTIVMVQLALIARLVTERARRRRAEGIVRARETSLRTSYDRIQQLAGRLINAQEAARASLAQDLHDDICQRLAMVSTTIDRLRRSSGQIQGDATQHSFTDLRNDTRKTFDAVKQLSHDLYPAALRVLGLAPALENHCAEIATRHNVEVRFTAEGDLRHIPSDVAISFFRIAQESLRNSVVHGAAHRLAVSLARSGNNIDMTVADDGCGFNLDAVGYHASGFGIVSMEERARVIGGKLHISTAVQQGTTIRISVPLLPPRRVSIPDVSARTDAMA
jgi:signal transduction histidine kinase